MNILSDTLTQTRRSFIKHTAASAAGFVIVPRHVLGGPDHVAPSDKVNIGLVGAGGRGRQNAAELLKLGDVQITAIADPAIYWDLKDFYYRSKAGRGPVKAMIEAHMRDSQSKYQVAEYEDFQKMLDKESSLDAILCATPDHTHAFVSIHAMRSGKHVYCEKPLTHNIWEARELKRLAKETGLATQLGNQGHSSPSVRNTVEHLRAGTIGTIQSIHAWVPASRWIRSLDGLPDGSSPIPYDFNWDLWLGPRSYRPFHHAYAPVTWRDFWEFGCGALGDFGCHDMDAAVWGLDLPLPSTVTIRPAGLSTEDIAPYGEIGYYRFPATLQQKAIDLTWYSGGLQPARPEIVPADFTFVNRGAMYIGEKGVMITDRSSEQPTFFPNALGQSPPTTLSPTQGHHRDWVDAIKGGPPASSHFDYGAHLTEITLLGVLSLRMGGQEIFC